MATAAQQVLRRILVHNKLLSEKQVDQLFEVKPDPDQAVAYLMSEGSLHERTAAQLLELLHKKVTALTGSEADDGTRSRPVAAPVPPVEPPPAAPAPAEKPAGRPVAAAKAAKPVHAEDLQPAPAHRAIAPLAEPAQGDPVADRAFIHGILQTALEMSASDVHITAGQPPLVRRYGRLQKLDLPAISPEQSHRTLVALLDDERRYHFLHHRDLDFCYDGAELGRFRTNYLVEQNGTGAIFRLIPSRIPSLEELRMPEIVRKFTDYRVGIVLVTGPKSSGKTTTLAAMIDLINSTRSEHIITIEDPIEFVHSCKKSHMSQREVGSHTRSFSNALRAALREAPDVIMVGEMRDLETTALAITAAETGHLVLATLHTPDAVRTIGRVLDVFPPKEQGQIRSMLSESLRGVVSQQLIPSKDGNSVELALEILVNTTAIGNLIREDRTFQLRGLMQTGRRLGMVLLDNSLLDMVKSDRITPDEALLRASDLAYVKKELGLNE